MKNIVYLILLLTVNGFSQTFPNWSSKFDFLGYGYVVATVESSTGDLYMAKNNEVYSATYPPSILKYNPLTEQLQEHYYNGYMMYKLNDIELVGDSVIYIACWDNSYNNVNSVYKKNVASTNWQLLGKANNEVKTLKYFNGKLYIGGSFTTLGTGTFYAIAAFNTSTNVFDSVPGRLHGLGSTPVVCDLESNGTDMFVVGEFLRAGVDTMYSVSRFNSGGWNKMSKGLRNGNQPGMVIALDVNPSNQNNISVVGNFNYFENNLYYPFPAGYLASWNSSINKWDTVPKFKSFFSSITASGPNNIFDVKYFNNDIHISYSYPKTNGDRIVKFNSSGWSFIPLKFTDHNPRGCGLSVYQGDLLISSNHSFPMHGTIRFDGTNNIKSFGSGIRGISQLRPIIFAEDNNDLYMTYGAGYMSSADNYPFAGGNKTAGDLIKFNYNTMSYDSLGSEFNGEIRGMKVSGDSLIALGKFWLNSYQPATFMKFGAIYRKSTKQWGPLIASSYTVQLSSSDYFKSIALYGSGFFIGGKFILNNDQNLQNLVYWNGVSFDSVKYAPHIAEINCLEITNDTLWVGGKFTLSVNGNSGFAAYKISTKQWLSSGSFIDYSTVSNSEVRSLKVYKNKIFVGGTFMDKYKPVAATSYTIPSYIGYFSRTNLNSYTPLGDFDSPFKSTVQTFYIKNDSIIYIGGGQLYKNSACKTGTLNCDSSYAIVEYDYVLNKFKGFYESGMRYTLNPYIPTVYYITEKNNKIFVSGLFNRAGSALNSINLAALTLGPPLSTGFVQMEDENSAQNIHIYPNPSSGEINVLLKGNEVKKVELIDVTGKTCFVSTSGSFYVDNLPSGLYLIRVISVNDKMFSRKLVISK